MFVFYTKKVFRNCGYRVTVPFYYILDKNNGMVRHHLYTCHKGGLKNGNLDVQWKYPMYRKTKKVSNFSQKLRKICDRIRLIGQDLLSRAPSFNFFFFLGCDTLPPILFLFLFSYQKYWKEYIMALKRINKVNRRQKLWKNVILINLYRNSKISNVTHLPPALQVLLATICFIGKQLLWVP